MVNSMAWEQREDGFKSETLRSGASSIICQWRLVDSSATRLTRPFRTLDLLLGSLSLGKNESINGDTAIEATDRTVDLLFSYLAKLDNTEEVALKVILAPHGGYVCMSNILDVRVQSSEMVHGVITFAPWDQYLQPLSLHNETSILQLLRSSPGAIVARKSQIWDNTISDLLEQHLNQRLNFDWILQSRPAPRTVAVVAGRPMCEPKRGVYWSQGYFEAAQALGISIIVLDNAGHWLQSPEYAHLCHEFIAIEIPASNTEKLPQTLVTALKDRNIDGIVTFTDEFVVATAEAAEILGLPTEPLQIMQNAHYKHKVRETATSTIPTVYLTTIKELENTVTWEKIASLEYPMIVKPARGQTSRGVAKVADAVALYEAVHQIEQCGMADTGILLEPYIDGPEFDGNFAIWNGKILFLEICDNFPCRGDDDAGNFAETALISHTALPAKEQEVIKSTLHRQLLQLGFHSGVFHVEARMKNSAMQYQDVRGDGVLDLVVSPNATSPRDNTTTSFPQPECFLIEVNARPPGAGGTWATRYTYGVDMGALHLLRAINDAARFAVLSHPFSFPDESPGGASEAQYWTVHCMIPIHRAHVYVPEDFFERLYEHAPEVKEHVCRAELYAQGGTVVSPYGGVGWVGYILLWSRSSRRHAVQMYNRVTEAARLILDEE